jgi:hypothetical protein
VRRRHLPPWLQPINNTVHRMIDNNPFVYLAVADQHRQRA